LGRENLKSHAAGWGLYVEEDGTALQINSFWSSVPVAVDEGISGSRFSFEP
jgi:hypothetical protein